MGDVGLIHPIISQIQNLEARKHAYGMVLPWHLSHVDELDVVHVAVRNGLVDLLILADALPEVQQCLLHTHITALPLELKSG